MLGLFHDVGRFAQYARYHTYLDRDSENHAELSVHVLEEIIDPSICLAYPSRPYSEQTVAPPALVRPVFERFKLLRNADENIYLRSGSVNVINGMVGLTFSCDGSHYMPVQDFLDKDDSFWFGTLTQ